METKRFEGNWSRQMRSSRDLGVVVVARQGQTRFREKSSQDLLGYFHAGSRYSYAPLTMALSPIYQAKGGLYERSIGWVLGYQVIEH